MNTELRCCMSSRNLYFRIAEITPTQSREVEDNLKSQFFTQVQRREVSWLKKGGEQKTEWPH